MRVNVKDLATVTFSLFMLPMLLGTGCIGLKKYWAVENEVSYFQEELSKAEGIVSEQRARLQLLQNDLEKLSAAVVQIQIRERGLKKQHQEDLKRIRRNLESLITELSKGQVITAQSFDKLGSIQRDLDNLIKSDKPQKGHF